MLQNKNEMLLAARLLEGLLTEATGRRQQSLAGHQEPRTLPVNIYSVLREEKEDSKIIASIVDEMFEL